MKSTCNAYVSIYVLYGFLIKMFYGYENTFLKFDIFVGEKIFEMLPAQKLLRYLPQCGHKTPGGI